MAAPENKPVTAYTLAIVGVALQLVAALVLIYIVFFSVALIEKLWVYGKMWSWMIHHGNGYFTSLAWIAVSTAIMIAVVGLGAYGAISMNSSDIDNIRTGATLVLVSSVIAFPTMWGFFIGSLLMFIGSLLGLTWQPSTS
jgi:hypothetical protein